MSKKFTKTILSSVVAGLLLASGGAMAQENIKIGDYTIKFYDNGDIAKIVNKNGEGIIANTVTGTITTVNTNEVNSLLEAFIKEHPEEKNAAQIIGERLRYTIDAPSLKKENINKLTSADLDKIKANVDAVAKTITSETAPVYREAIKNGMTSEDALAVVNQDKTGGLLKQFNGLNTNVNALKDTTTFALDENGEITDGQGVETVSVKSVVADVKADTTIYQNKDGSYTLDQSAPGNVRVNDAVVSLDNRTRSNTQAIQNHSRQLQEHNARLNSQQRQIRENHEEMKRAAAQSAALSGLFQPYSVGKFNATAALGGYSDKQAVAVGVGYRFNEQTAAKAGIAASDGDVSYNVGVNFEF
ncbi:YadA C-terminal domain-containing protein [Escherichia coli]|nr:YadA-like family protein [Escherichia coli]